MYFFDSQSALDSAVDVLRNSGMIGKRLHVAYLNTVGKFKWYSPNQAAAASDPARQTALQDELANLEAQVRQHEDNLSDFDDGSGYIAMLSDADFRNLTERPKDFRSVTKDVLYKRNPELHTAREQLDHSGGDLSRNHIVAYGHTRLIMLYSLLGRENAEIFDVLKRLGGQPLSQADADLSIALRQQMLDMFNNPSNLYIGRSVENSAAGNRMKLLMDARLKLVATPDSTRFRDLTQEYVKEALDVPKGKTDGGLSLSSKANDAALEIDRLNAKWDNFEDIRREAFRIRMGEADPANPLTDLDVARQNLLELKGFTAKMLDDIHTGSVETNDYIRAQLAKAMRLELLLSEAINSIGLRTDVLP